MSRSPGDTGPRELIVEADGGSRGNPGVAGYGAVVRDGATGRILVELAEPLGVASNNVAEYSGLLAGLRAAVDISADAAVHVRLDSKLVVEQMSGRWKIKHEDMRRLALEAQDLCTGIRTAGGSVDFEWVPRHRNKEADALSNEAMDGKSVHRVLEPARGAPTAAPAGSRATEAPGRPGEGGRRDLRLLLVQVPAEAGAIDAVVAAALPLLGSGAHVVSSPEPLAAQTASAIAAAAGVEASTSPAWAANAGRAGTSEPDEASSAAYDRLREEGGTVVVVTTRRGVVTVLAEVLGLGPDRLWSLATAPGSLTGVEVWADGTASVAFTNRTDHLA